MQPMTDVLHKFCGIILQCTMKMVNDTIYLYRQFVGQINLKGGLPNQEGNILLSCFVL